MTPQQRLEQLRAEWPDPIRLDEVPPDDPFDVHVRRRRGIWAGSVCGLVALALLGIAALFASDSAEVSSIAGFLALLACGFSLYGFTSSPFRYVKRQSVFDRFAARRSLMSLTTDDEHMPAVGVLLGGRPRERGARVSRRSRGLSLRYGVRTRSGVKGPVDAADFVVAVAHGSSQFDLNYREFRGLKLQLPRHYPHALVVPRWKRRAAEMLERNQRIAVPGDLARRFAVYSTADDAPAALAWSSPATEAFLREHGRRWNLEVVGDLLVVASPCTRPRHDRDETTALIVLAELVARQAGAEPLAPTQSGRQRGPASHELTARLRYTDRSLRARARTKRAQDRKYSKRHERMTSIGCGAFFVVLIALAVIGGLLPD